MIAPVIDRNIVIGALRNVLERDDAVTKCSAVKALEKLHADDEQSSAQLVDLLLDEDPDVRMDAVVALGHMKVQQAALPLLENLEKDPEGEIRIEVVNALSQIRSSQTVERLIHCFKEDGYPELDYQIDDMEFNACWEVQNNLMDALAEIGDLRAVDPLIEVLESGGYEDLHESGFRALARLSGNTARDFLLNQLKQGDRLARRRAAIALSELPEILTKGESSDQSVIPPDILSGLTNALSDNDYSVRINAAQALAVSSSTEIVAPITRLLKDPNTEVKVKAAEILARIRGADIVDQLQQLLNESNRDVRISIVRVLGKIGYPSSQQIVGPFLDSSNRNLQYEAVCALENIGVNGFEKKLSDMLSDEDNHQILRMQVARTLGSFIENDQSDNEVQDPPPSGESKSQECNPESVLKEAVYYQDESVAGAALQALVRVKPDYAVENLIGVLQFYQDGTEQEYPAIGKSEHLITPKADPELDESSDETSTPRVITPAIAELIKGQSAQTSTLVAILENQPSEEIDSTDNSDSDVNQQQIQPGVLLLAIRLLGKFRNLDKEVVDLLIHLSQDSDQELRKEVIHVLGHTGEESALDTVLNAVSAEHDGVRLAALDALCNFTGSKGVPARLLEMLDDPDPTIRQRVVEQINLLPGSEVNNFLCKALEDDDLGVCRAALNVLTAENYSAEIAQRVESLMFRFSGDLRQVAAAALRRVEDFSSSSRLLDNLMDEEHEQNHWVLIDALAEMYSGPEGKG